MLRDLALILAGLTFLFAAFFVAQVHFFHSSEFNEEHHQQSTMHMIGEAVGIYYRTGAETVEWMSRQHTLPLDLSKEVVLVTGGNRGLGRGIVAHLASFGPLMVLPCRRCPNDFKAQVLKDAREVRSIYGGNPNSIKDVRLEIFNNFDLGDMDSIDEFVDMLQTKGIRVTILIANAGLVDALASKTKHQFETTFGVNFFGNVYLTHSLWNKRILEEHARVVSVSSEDARVGPPIRERVKSSGKPFGAYWGDGLSDTMYRYMYSKLAQTTWYLALARKSSLEVIDMCPGPVGSEISMTAPWPLNEIVTPILALLFPSTQRAAIPVVRFAVDKEFAKESGSHFHLGEKKPARADARNPEVQDQVWKWTLDLFSKRVAPA